MNKQELKPQIIMDEREIIAFEAARNAAMDAWFNARSNVLRSKHNEFIFEAGFRMAWNTRAGESK